MRGWKRVGNGGEGGSKNGLRDLTQMDLSTVLIICSHLNFLTIWFKLVSIIILFIASYFTKAEI